MTTTQNTKTTVKPNIHNIYARMRNSGYTAIEAMRTAKIVDLWAEYESDDETPDAPAVRLRLNGECENYFDVYGEPEGYTNLNGHRITAQEERDEIAQSIERNGCYVIVSEYWDGEEWRLADSIGMCVYKNPLSPIENCYVPDLMRAALEAMEAQSWRGCEI